MQDYDFSNFDDFGTGVVDDEHVESEFRLAGGAALAVVDGDDAVRDYLAGLFDGTVDTAASLDQLEPRLGLASRVVVLGPTLATPEDLTTVEIWGRRYPHVATVMVTAELSTQLLHKALRAGVKDVLSAPIDTDQLMESIDRVADGLPSAEQLVAGSPPPPQESYDQVGRVITVFSTKGGSGKSVVATNLAVALARRSSRPVVLIDGHLQFGDAAVMLKLHPKRTVVDAIDQLDALDAGMIDDLTTVHEPSGLRVLPAPLEPTFADQISGVQFTELVEKVRATAGYVIIDLPAIFNEVVLNVIETSDDIIFVAGLDIPNIKNVKIAMGTLNMLNVPKEKLHLVLNRADSKVKLDVSEVERTLGVTAAAHVPSDVVVPISVNKGEPVVLSAPKSGPARAFEQLASRFLSSSGAEVVASSRRKFFG